MAFFHRGNWSPYIPRNIILRYSIENDLVLDQFVGGGTTLVETKLLHRDCIGVIENDISRCAIPEYLKEMESVARECFRVLKNEKFCVILMGDTQHKDYAIPLGFSVMKIF